MVRIFEQDIGELPEASHQSPSRDLRQYPVNYQVDRACACILPKMTTLLPKPNYLIY
jgi:hypothetical protein